MAKPKRGGKRGGKRGSVNGVNNVQPQINTQTLAQQYNDTVSSIKSYGFNDTQDLSDYINLYNSYAGKVTANVKSGFSKDESIISGTYAEVGVFLKHLKNDLDVMVTSWGKPDSSGYGQWFVSNKRTTDGVKKSKPKKTVKKTKKN